MCFGFYMSRHTFEFPWHVHHMEIFVKISVDHTSMHYFRTFSALVQTRPI